MALVLEPVDRFEVLSLQDNFVDLAAFDSTAVVRRAWPVKDGEVTCSIGAEHGFSALVTVTDRGTERSVLFDFGFSRGGAVANADALGVDLNRIDAMVLSHGHLDHHGGLLAVAERLDRKGVPLIAHPAAFRTARYIRLSEALRFRLPAPDRDAIERSGVSVVEAKGPRSLVDGKLLYLGEIPRKASFESGFPHGYYEDGGVERPDPMEDDSAIVGHVRGRGLVVLTGCAHSGIVNTVNRAKAVTGIDDVFAIMGGFHLTGAAFEPRIGPTVEALKALRPRYVVPAHCTGHRAVMALEREMPEQFLLNMSGTRMVFASEEC